MTAAVSIKGVTKRFGTDVTAVDNVTLDIADGEFFSLLGPSGCGKTTMLRMIAGLEFPTEGSIQIFGEELALRPPNKRPVNTVFQSYALFPHMNVEKNVSFGLEMRKVAKDEIKERVAQAIEAVHLGGMETRRPNQLSGGQQQRVALARALVNRPKVLLLDEPLGALDLKLRQAMEMELKDIQSEVGITFIYVTHDQEEALTMSNRIGVMNSGKLLQVGTSEEIYEHPTNRFVADFIGETNFIGGTVTDDGRIRIADGALVYARCDASPGAEVTVALRPEKLRLHAPDADDIESSRNRLPATVTRRLYYGESIYYEIALEDGTLLDVRHENIPSLRRWNVGDRITVSFHREAGQALTS